MIDIKQTYKGLVDENLIDFVTESVFPEYEKNDKGHGLLHIVEVIRRSFELNKTLNLNLNNNMIFTIAACHDNGKYVDHKTHEKIAAERFYAIEGFKNFFTEEERKTIKEAIEDHRSSLDSEPRSDYGKLISSADRNSSIDIVFKRSFFVGVERTPDMIVEDFLDFTINRLRKRYNGEKQEKMFYVDEVYKEFLADMRKILEQVKPFKDRYCRLNNIKNRKGKLANEQGPEI